MEFVVLNVGKLVGKSSAAYYLEKVASGVEDYYLHAGEAPGMWLTGEAARLGLRGEVVAEELMALLRGEDPRTGERLAARQRAADRMWGWDLTFRAPKSVSLLFALGARDVPREVRGAHETAILAALAYLERQACFGRRRIDGAIRALPAQGFLAAGFQHRTSRAGDPLLHTHVLVANLVRGVDDRWGAIDGRLLYTHAKAAGAIYEAELRTQLSARLGVAWTPVRNGLADVLGVTPAVIRAFSRRRQEITAHMAARGETSARAAQVATLETRKGKDRAVRPEGLLPEWRARAAALGFGPEALVATMGRTTPYPQTATPTEAIAVLLSPAGLTAHASSFTRRDVLVALCDRLPASTPAAHVERLADLTLSHPDVVDLAGAGAVAPYVATLRRDDGRVVPGPDERRFSTRELLALEQSLIARAVSSGGRGAVARPDAVEAALSRRPSLSEEQLAMCRRLLTSGDAIQVVRGHAGTGKTFALGACHEAWTASGLEVVGCALSARAAAEMQTGAGITSSTLHRLLHELEPPSAIAATATGHPRMLPLRTLGRGTVVVVDEAAMVGTRQLSRLVDHAARAGASLVLVGDDHQLPEIDAGGAFRGLANRLGAIELTDNRRQVKLWERQALRLLREGRPREALAAYEAHDRVVTEASVDDVRERMVADWWTARQESGDGGSDVVMVANRRSDVRDLNERARVHRLVAGEVSGPELRLPGGSIAVGDEVLCKRNNRGLGVLNGSRGVITAVDAVRRSVSVRMDGARRGGGRTVALPAAYLDEGHLTHSYAMTAHSAQGMTAARALVLGDDTVYREWGYVALSRGRQENRMYIVAGDRTAETRDALHGPAANPQSPIADAIAALAAARAQFLATDMGARAVGAAAHVGRGAHGRILGEGHVEEPDVRSESDNGVALGAPVVRAFPDADARQRQLERRRIEAAPIGYGFADHDGAAAQWAAQRSLHL